MLLSLTPNLNCQWGYPGTRSFNRTNTGRPVYWTDMYDANQYLRRLLGANMLGGTAPAQLVNCDKYILDDNGYVDPANFTPDLIHLSPQGKTLTNNYLRKKSSHTLT